MRTVSLFAFAAVLAGFAHAQSPGPTQPSLIYRSEPEYSAEATRARVQSTVVLSVVIGEDGKARDVHVAQGAGFGLDEKAIEAMDKWRFNPATRDGAPVPFPANIEMNFSVLVRNDPDDRSGQRARLNFTLPEGATRPELVLGRLPGNSKTPGDQAVRIRLSVDVQGVPRNVTVLESNDAAWDKAITRTIQAWRFRPAAVNGAALAVEGVFELEHSGPPEPAAPPVPVTIDMDDSDSSPAPRHLPAPLPVSGLAPRSGHTATRLANGTVLIAGGFSEKELTSAQTFDWATRRISNTGNLLTARRNHTATLLRDGTVLITGGEAGGHALASAEIFDPSTGRFSAAGTLREARTAHAAALLPDGRVLICGGTGSNGAKLNTAEIYDPRVKAFLPAGKMNAARSAFTALPLKDGRVLIAGGAGTSAEIFNPVTGSFIALGDTTLTASAQAAALLPDAQVLLTDGDSTAIFNPASDTFQPAAKLSMHLDRPAIAPLDAARAIVLGGTLPTQICDARAGACTAGPVLKAAGTGETATALEDGGILIAGSDAELVLIQ